MIEFAPWIATGLCGGYPLRYMQPGAWELGACPKNHGQVTVTVAQIPLCAKIVRCKYAIYPGINTKAKKELLAGSTLLQHLYGTQSDINAQHITC